MFSNYTDSSMQVYMHSIYIHSIPQVKLPILSLDLCLDMGCISVHKILPTGKYLDFFSVSVFLDPGSQNVIYVLLFFLAIAAPGKASSVSGDGSPISPAEGSNSPAIPLSEAHILLQRGQSQQAGSEETAPSPTPLRHGKL